MAFRLLLYHEIEDWAVARLEEAGVEIKLRKYRGKEAMMEDLADCDCIFFFERPESGFDKDLIDAAKRLKLLANDGVGYDAVNVPYTTQNGIYVTNTPGVNAQSVAEATLLLMIGCNRNIQRISDKFRRERSAYNFFNSNPNSRGNELFGKTLSLIGCGNIGRRVADICVNGLGMTVYGYDPYINGFPSGIHMVDTMQEALAIGDYVSLHLPSGPSTRRSFGMEKFKMMKPTAYFINAARGDIVCEDELVKALEEKVIAGAGLDVYQTEPIAQSSDPLFDMDRVFLLPHMAAFTWESHDNSVASMVDSIIEGAKGLVPTHRVNNPKNPRLLTK